MSKTDSLLIRGVLFLIWCLIPFMINKQAQEHTFLIWMWLGMAPCFVFIGAFGYDRTDRSG